MTSNALFVPRATGRRLKPEQAVDRNKIVCTGWIGRFGNRCHTYLYGKHIEQTFGYRFYVPAPWEGSVLFRNPSPVFPETVGCGCRACRHCERGPEHAARAICQAVEDFNRKTGDSLIFADVNRAEHYGKPNIAFRSLVTDAPWFFPKVSRADLKGYFCFSDELKKSEVYRELEAQKGTYDAAHWRRTDISRANYKGGHSMVSYQSYLDAFEEFDADPDAIEWVSDEPDIGWKWSGTCPVIGGMRLPWLPDFLKLVFARRLFRSNSAFSTWAAWLGDPEVFSPWLHRYAPGEEIDVRFVRGNHPHWMSVKGAHASYQFPLKGEACTEPTARPAANAPMQYQTEVDTNYRETTQKRPQILMAHWVGRFGGRMCSVAFGRHYAEKFDHDFYVPSEWEGSILFEDTGCKVVEDDELRLRINQTHPALHNAQYRRESIEEYGQRTNTHLTFIDPHNPKHYGKSNVYFDSGCSHCAHAFPNYSRTRIREWFRWSEAVKSLEIYKHLEQIQGTYDIAHLRRDDISSPKYNQNHCQAYSVVSKESYFRAFRKFGFDPQKVEWTTDDRTGKWLPKAANYRSAGWTYPFGSHHQPDIIFDWLPDFLRLYFARTIFRANSSFSWWAACLSPSARIFSPVLSEEKIYLNEGDELDCEFVEGNHPHWINAASSNTCPNILIAD